MVSSVQFDRPEDNRHFLIYERVEKFILQIERQIKCPIWLVVKYPLTT